MKISGNMFSRTQTAYQNWREPQYLRSLARTYWHTIIGVSVISVFCVIAYGMSSLRAIQSESGNVPFAATTTSSVDKSVLSRTLKGLADRSVRFESLKSGALQIGDPSR